MKGERDILWLLPATKVLTAHSDEAREGGQMKGEHDTAWLAPAFAVLKCKTSDSQQCARKETLARKERTRKRHAKQRKA